MVTPTGSSRVITRDHQLGSWASTAGQPSSSLSTTSFVPYPRRCLLDVPLLIPNLLFRLTSCVASAVATSLHLDVSVPIFVHSLRMYTRRTVHHAHPTSRT